MEQKFILKRVAHYYKDSDEYIAITDNNGSTPAFNFTDNWGGRSNTSSAYAVEKQKNGSYKLAVKKVETLTSPVAFQKLEPHGMFIT